MSKQKKYGINSPENYRNNGLGKYTFWNGNTGIEYKDETFEGKFINRAQTNTDSVYQQYCYGLGGLYTASNGYSSVIDIPKIFDNEAINEKSVVNDLQLNISIDVI